ncbi:hypothetical protein FPQ18DRAFT_134541 [Pyronema domesticum]|nr:hypothetical protein FPQ18DRAFT_134541 [Pyronema domesticum]
MLSARLRCASTASKASSRAPGVAIARRWSSSSGSGYTNTTTTKEPIKGPLSLAADGGVGVTPKVLKSHLDRYIIGQDRAKRILSTAVYHHYQRITQLQRRELEAQGRREREAREAFDLALQQQEREAREAAVKGGGNNSSSHTSQTSSSHENISSSPGLGNSEVDASTSQGLGNSNEETSPGSPSGILTAPQLKALLAGKDPALIGELREAAVTTPTGSVMGVRKDTAGAGAAMGRDATGMGGTGLQPLGRPELQSQGPRVRRMPEAAQVEMGKEKVDKVDRVGEQTERGGKGMGRGMGQGKGIEDVEEELVIEKSNGGCMIS